MCGEETHGASSQSGFGRPTIALVAAVAAILTIYLCLPLLATPHERPCRSKCMSNLKQISHACELYSKDNAGAFPPDLATLLPGYVDDSRLFVCPMLRHDGHVMSPKPDTFIPEAVCYAYVSGMRATDNRDFVLAFEEEWNHRQTGACVLHVERLKVACRSNTDTLHDELQKQRAALAAEGRSMKVIRPTWSRWPDAPDYPVRPWHERPATTALIGFVATAVAGGTVALMIKRLRVRRAGVTASIS